MQIAIQIHIINHTNIIKKKFNNMDYNNSKINYFIF